MKFKNFSILFFCIFIILSCKNNDSISFNFCQENLIITESEICYSLENNSNKTYVFYISKFLKTVIKDQNENDAKIIGPIFISRKPTTSELNSAGIKLKNDSALMKKLNEEELKVNIIGAMMYKNQKLNRIILKPNEKAEFTREIIFSKNQLTESGSYYSLNKKNNYKIQTEIEIDSSKIKEFLTKKDIDSLKKNNIIIFHGKLKTKKQNLEL